MHVPKGLGVRGASRLTARKRHGLKTARHTAFGNYDIRLLLLFRAIFTDMDIRSIRLKAKAVAVDKYPGERDRVFELCIIN